jgi:hypothetical protein
MKLRWRFGIVAGIFLAVFSLYPQFKMLYLRGDAWNGHYAYNDIDEVAYAAYLKALIDGRPRKNDPYTGRDDSPENPQPESLFSIQFAAPYSIAIPARILGVDAPWAMTIAGALAAFLTALAVFWLLARMFGSELFAMAGSIVVLAGGALFAGEGAIGEILGTSYSYPYFPGFRRYIPALAFPAFFAMLALLWKLTGNGKGEAVDKGSGNIALAFGVALCFAFTVYSYFYVWTSAAAVLACFSAVWLIFRPENYVRALKSLALVGVGCVLAIVPYTYLLSKRSHTMDDVQLLVLTRDLDLTRPPEMIGFMVLAVIIVGAATGIFRLRDKATLFTAVLAITPAILFNQQVITGRSLQPIHYQVFIGNYIAGVAVVGAVGLLWREAFAQRRTAAVVLSAVLATLGVVWGFVECHYTVRVLDEANIARDEALPAARRVAELTKGDPGQHKRTVLHLGIAEGDDLPTLAPVAVLWARHQHVFAGVTWQENKERYYQQLCYQGVGGKQLADGMKHGGDFVSMIALFGWGRHTDRLNAEHKPLTFGEIDEEARVYEEYCTKFDPHQPGAIALDYLITPEELDPYMDNIDRWYERTDREQFGRFILYKLNLK